jgi:hypothetical protein
MTHEELDLGEDLTITKTTRRHSGGGTWVIGTLHGHRFEALVFAEHAEVADYELGDSRISKLWIRRIKDRHTTYHWDRGLDVPAADQLTQSIVDFLAGGLADYVE